ncbi:MAG: hypothetical protein WBC51_17815 [Vicinamibacterales bacterium]
MLRESNTRWRSALGATLGASALLFTFACGGTARDLTTVAAQPLSANQPGVPVLVNCEPHQRALVRPVVVNGAAVSQVECVAVGQPAAYAQNQLAAPVSYGATAYPVANTVQPAYGLGDAQIVSPAPAPVTVARPVRTRQVVYDERPVRRTRSVKKSAIIIGSSAGVGAGVGAAVGGKKGALIGAAIGGGSAAIWDQVTRRN